MNPLIFLRICEQGVIPQGEILHVNRPQHYIYVLREHLVVKVLGYEGTLDAVVSKNVVILIRYIIQCVIKGLSPRDDAELRDGFIAQWRDDVIGLQTDVTWCIR